MSSPVSIYIHVPFCLKRHKAAAPDVCEAPRELRQRYLDALDREIEAAGDLIDGRELASVYVGGGASLLRPDLLARTILGLKRRMKPVRAMELTVHFAPQALVSTSLSGLNICSFNRIALEALAQRDQDFAFLDAPFAYGTVEDGLNMATLFKFPNCDVELVYGLPDQSPRALENALCAYANFHNVNHVTLRPYTGEGRLDDAVLAERFAQATTYLGSRGFALYGANRFARPGKECRFFVQECEGAERIGFGAAAQSQVDGFCYRNTPDIGRYLEGAGSFEAITVDPVQLDPAADQLRRLALRLQLAAAFELEEVLGTPAPQVRRALEHLAQEGLAQTDGKRVQATALALRRPELVWECCA